MNNEQARAVFNAVIASETDPDKVARLELVREYFTNPPFRKALEQHVFELSAERNL